MRVAVILIDNEKYVVSLNSSLLEFINATYPIEVIEYREAKENELIMEI